MSKAQSKKTLITNRLGRQYWTWESDSFYMQRLQSGPYQKQNLLCLRKLCPNAHTILDIGMNIGMNTIEYATWAKEVHGFEPVPTTYALAVENIKLNSAHDNDKGWWLQEDGTYASLLPTGKIYTHNIALGTEASTVEMQIKTCDGFNHVANEDYATVTGRPRKKNTSDKRVESEQRTLDSYRFNDVDVIKIDVEGYELFVLEGASETIERNRPIVQIETVEVQQRLFGKTTQDIVNYFNERDYIVTTSDGVVRGSEWFHTKRMMDRFMIPKEKL